MTVDTYDVRPGQSFTAILGGQPSETGQLPPSYPPPGLTGRLGVQIVPLAGGAPILARTTTGVQEQLPNSAIYAVQLTAPAQTGDYSVLWDYNGNAAPFYSQTLQVDSSIPVAPPSGGATQPVYVQIGQATDAANNIISLTSYLSATMLAQGTALGTPELNRIIVEAELEIDSILGFWIRDPATGRKLNMTNIVPVAPISPFPGELFAPYQRGLTVYQKAALQNAVCAQVEYHLAQGEQFFQQTQYDSVSGPQFSRQGRPDRIAPKAREHLAGMGLQRLTARALV